MNDYCIKRGFSGNEQEDADDVQNWINHWSKEGYERPVFVSGEAAYRLEGCDVIVFMTLKAVSLTPPDR